MNQLEIISLGLIFFSVIVITLGIIKIHTYPGKIAAARNHPQTEAIEVTSLLGLLIFPLWMAALVWAYSGAVVGVLYDTGDGGGGGEPVDTKEGGGVAPVSEAAAPTAVAARSGASLPAETSVSAKASTSQSAAQGTDEGGDAAALPSGDPEKGS